MFRIAIGLLVVALIAAVLGFGGLAGTAVGFAKIVFFVAIVLAVVSFLLGGRGSKALPLLALGGLGVLGLTGVARAQEAVYEPAGGISAARTGITFGGGIGMGHIECEGADCDGVNEAGGLDLHVGGMVAPRLALVIDLWGMTHRESDEATFTQAMLTAGLRFWAAPRVWLGGGVGIAEASWRYSSDVIDFESRSDTVPALMGGVGVELVSTRTFALDLTLRGGTGFFEDDVRVRNLSLGVGVSWF